MAQTVKNPPAVQETWVRPLGWEDPLEKETATHSSIMAWRIPRSLAGYGVVKTWTRLSNFHFLQSIKKKQIDYNLFFHYTLVDIYGSCAVCQIWQSCSSESTSQPVINDECYFTDKAHKAQKGQATDPGDTART